LNLKTLPKSKIFEDMGWYKKRRIELLKYAIGVSYEL
jgi:hypothetical protein